MRISTILKMTAALMIGALTVTSCANDVETDINIDPSGDAISFSPSVGHASRATEVKLSNLGSFAVVARGMHQDGVLYDTYLIGSGTAGEVATRDGNTSIWKLDRSVYWPSTFENVMFFAYTTLKSGEEGSVLYGTGTSFGFENKNPFIEGYAPKKADLTATSDAEATVWADGKEQKDLLVAYTYQNRTTEGTSNVPLTFKHALTQISITAGQMNKTDNDNRVVKIKGAWIVNAAETGKLLGDLHYNSTTQKSSDQLSWTGTGKVAYGSFYNQILQLEEDGKMDLLRPEGSSDNPIQGSMMLIPEDLTAWNKTQYNNGAYILLLCRVELKHKGATHTTTDDENVDMTDIYTEGNYHYHQLFPVNTTKYDAAEYGFVCVPLSSTWNTDGIGKHYTYHLDICGATTDAGLYPPTLTEEFVNGLIPKDSKVNGNKLSVVRDRPDGKNVGDPVLDQPIQFSVTVDDWQDPEEGWKPGIN